MTDVTEIIEVKHPAKFNDAILAGLQQILAPIAAHADHPITVLDPFGGVGGIHELAVPDKILTFAIELEPEWARQSLQRGPTITGDFFEVTDEHPEWDGHWDVVVTSPTYGNRMADHHVPGPDDKSTRLTYRHKLGRELSPNNSGGMQWGDEYRTFHRLAWRRVHRLLRPGAWFILNVKDHVRKGEPQGVPEWHEKILTRKMFRLVEDCHVPVRGMGFGANQQTHKIPYEHVYVFRKDS